MKLTSVMIIDDDEGNQFLSKYLIEDLYPKIKIYQAYDGQEGLEILTTLDKQPDIIFLDINMPVMDGHQFLKKYSQEEEQTAVIVMLTSSDQEIDKERSGSYSCVKKYLQKPLGKDSLKEAIALILE